MDGTKLRSSRAGRDGHRWVWYHVEYRVLHLMHTFISRYCKSPTIRRCCGGGLKPKKQIECMHERRWLCASADPEVPPDGM